MTSKDPTHSRLEKIIEVTGGVKLLRGDEESTVIQIIWILRPRRLTHKITLAEIRPIRQQYYQEDDTMRSSLIRDIRLWCPVKSHSRYTGLSACSGKDAFVEPL